MKSWINGEWGNIFFNRKSPGSSGKILCADVHKAHKKESVNKMLGNAWEKIKANPEMIIRSFKKCGITTAADGSEDDQVHIEGVEGYAMPLPEKEFHLESSSDDDDNDENYMLCYFSSYCVVSNNEEQTNSCNWLFCLKKCKLFLLFIFMYKPTPFS